MKRTLTAVALALIAATATTLGALAPSAVEGQTQNPPAAPPAQGQPRPPVPLETALQNQHRSIRGFLARSAEMMPEADYSFKPTPAQRTFGELIGHVAQANFQSCAAMLSEPNPVQGRRLEQELKTKAELVKALNDSLALCDRAYGAVTAANAAEMITAGPNQASRGGRMAGNTAHNNESYGTMVVYMRLKGLVPPSSEPR